MRRSLGLAGAVGTMVAVGVLALSPAASAGDTQVDVVVSAGALTISAQPATATLTGAVYNATTPSTASGAFGTVEVTDGRGLATPWTVSASSTDFTGIADPGQGIDLAVASPLTFEASTVTVGPGATDGVGAALGGALTASGASSAIATGTNAVTSLGDVTYSWNPQLTMVVPAGTPPQTYRGTVTLTVA